MTPFGGQTHRRGVQKHRVERGLFLPGWVQNTRSARERLKRSERRASKRALRKAGDNT